jgi:hypothetical protein
VNPNHKATQTSPQYFDRGVQTMGITRVDCRVQASAMSELSVCNDPAGHTLAPRVPLSPYPRTVNIAEVQVSKSCSRAQTVGQTYRSTHYSI